MKAPRSKVPRTTGEVAKIIDVSSRRVQQLADAGRLTTVRTSSGQRLFVDDDEIEQLRAERHARLHPEPEAP